MARACFALPDEALATSTPWTRGFWRMADFTMEAAFKGKTLDEAIRDEEQFRHLGFWSDGRKVIQPIVGVDLDAIPRVIPANGLRLFPWGFRPAESRSDHA